MKTTRIYFCGGYTPLMTINEASKFQTLIQEYFPELIKCTEIRDKKKSLHDLKLQHERIKSLAIMPHHASRMEYVNNVVAHYEFIIRRLIVESGYNPDESANYPIPIRLLCSDCYKGVECAY